MPGELDSARDDLEHGDGDLAARKLARERLRLFEISDVDGLSEVLELAQDLPSRTSTEIHRRDRLVYEVRQNIRFLTRKAAISVGETWSDPFGSTSPTSLPSRPLRGTQDLPVSDDGTISPISQDAPPTTSEPPSLESTDLCTACGKELANSYFCTYCYQMEGFPIGVTRPSREDREFFFLLDLALLVVTLYIGWLIWSLIVWQRGQTPAKQIARMRVINLKTGLAADRGCMAKREIIGKWLLYVVVGVFLTLFIGTFVIDWFFKRDERQRSVFDHIAGTIVVKDPGKLLLPKAKAAFSDPVVPA